MKTGDTFAMQRIMDAVDAAHIEGDDNFADCAFDHIAVGMPLFITAKLIAE